MARALDILGDPWAVMILREVFMGNRRFDGLKDELAIADTVLSKRLRVLVEAGLLQRVPYGGAVRPRVEYVLTEAGSDTLPVLNALAQWGRSPHRISHRGLEHAGRVPEVRPGEREARIGAARVRRRWIVSTPVGGGPANPSGLSRWQRGRRERDAPHPLSGRFVRHLLCYNLHSAKERYATLRPINSATGDHGSLDMKYTATHCISP